LLADDAAVGFANKRDLCLRNKGVALRDAKANLGLPKLRGF
jgi:hypothetical protein